MSGSDDLRLLRERGAAALEHPGGDLLTHLVRTGDRLERWDAPAALVTADVRAVLADAAAKPARRER